MKRLAIALLFLPILLLGQITGPLPPVYQQSQSVQIAPGLYAHTNPSAGDAAYQNCMANGGTDFVCWPVKINAIGAEAQNRVTSIFGAFFNWLSSEHLFYNAPNGKCYGECPSMAYSLIAHVASATNGNGTTSAGINTTGADLLVAMVSGYSGNPPSISDSYSNTWTPLTAVVGGANAGHGQLYYVKNATVGAGHTFTIATGSSFPSLCVAAFSGSDLTAPFDVENGALTVGVTSAQPGSITPGSGNELIITGLASAVASSLSASGFTKTDEIVGVSSTYYGCGLAYQIQTSATSVNPTWSWTTTDEVEAVIASFKSSGGGGGFVAVNRRTLGPRVGSRSVY